MSPDEAAAYLAEIAYMLRHKGDSHRARAFTRVASMLLRDRPDLEALTRAGQLERLEGVGAGIARTLAELVETRHSSYLERLRAEVAPQLAAVEAVLKISPLVETGYQGDLHCHTDWSDGGASVLEMARAAQARGYRYLAITDHSPRITVVNGLGPERLAAQRRLIDQANAELDALTLLQGVEVDINEDGSLDEPDEALAALDVVIASPHVKLRMEAPAMTERMLRAVEHPHVDVIGHPTGRRPGSREGASYDFERVFKSAAEHGVVMEIDCDPARMDLSPELARLAASLGCRISLDSDAHAPDQLLYVDLALWMAQRAGIGTDGLVNWLELSRLREVFN
ncbi:PHP domain-containing protein [Candidatus Nephthysia bennettiae]|uniref:PHP domain-containing protein n=1 Tax=Candidatus Nephthysia bennettiae TaxID=3127016 RepID=A0A934JZS8_9BACT|nr:PHP domain-containing protein [Candidatus Dormibacteraeota bacterium]MBJ7611584.1 PHP domain-containing protein [Candidatus Dormibacteraeota bacterium]